MCKQVKVIGEYEGLTSITGPELLTNQEKEMEEEIQKTILEILDGIDIDGGYNVAKAE